VQENESIWAVTRAICSPRSDSSLSTSSIVGDSLSASGVNSSSLTCSWLIGGAIALLARQDRPLLSGSGNFLRVVAIYFLLDFSVLSTPTNIMKLPRVFEEKEGKLDRDGRCQHPHQDKKGEKNEPNLDIGPDVPHNARLRNPGWLGSPWPRLLLTAAACCLFPAGGTAIVVTFLKYNLSKRFFHVSFLAGSYYSGEKGRPFSGPSREHHNKNNNAERSGNTAKDIVSGTNFHVEHFGTPSNIPATALGLNKNNTSQKRALWFSPHIYTTTTAFCCCRWARISHTRIIIEARAS